MTESIESCDCGIGDCEKGDYQASCPRFLARAGDLEVNWCDYCRGYTWHQNGACLKIARREPEE